MTDDPIFEARLGAALGRFAEHAPSIDAEAIARTAIEADRPGRSRRWLSALRGGPMAPTTGRDLRVVYLIALLILLFAAMLFAIAGGARRDDPLRLVGGNGAIVYSFTGTGHEAIESVVLDPGGAPGRTIAAGRCPTYARTGDLLAWISYEPSAYLVVAGPDGRPSRRILLVDTPELSVSFAVSPDGRYVAWFKPATPDVSRPSPSGRTASSPASRVELWVAPVDGGAGFRIVPASSLPGASYDAPVWSPDGRMIAFGTYVRDPRTGESERTAIDVVAADGSDRRRLTTRPGLLGDAVAWSSDNRRVAYSARSDETPQRDLYVIGVDGTGDRQLTDTPVSEHHPAWSPDDAVLAFETSTEGVADRLATMPLDAATSVGSPVVGPASDWFVWSPDGQQLLWQEVTSIGRETYRTVLHSIDRDLRQPSTTLQVVEGLIVCPPSWQRLAR